MNWVSCVSDRASPSILTVQYADNLKIEVGLALRTEHVCLESDELIVAERPHEVRVGPTFKFASRLRACETELSFCTDHRLAIRQRRRRRAVQKYSVDLRFVAPAPVAARRIAWRWWQATATLTATGALWHWITQQLTDPAWHRVGLWISLGLLAVTLGVGLLGFYRTRETIQLRSVHGDALLAEITGGLGCARAAGPFLAELRRRIEAARAQAPRSKQQFLRDEMREHHRLWTEGVLADAAYDASKRRILHSHG